MWWCSNACRHIEGREDLYDGVQAYVKAVGLRGLIDLCTRDMIREGDGPAINTDWRLSMADFIMHNHTNYFSIGHNILAGMLFT